MEASFKNVGRQEPESGVPSFANCSGYCGVIIKILTAGQNKFNTDNYFFSVIIYSWDVSHTSQTSMEELLCILHFPTPEEKVLAYSRS